VCVSRRRRRGGVITAEGKRQEGHKKEGHTKKRRKRKNKKKCTGDSTHFDTVGWGGEEEEVEGSAGHGHVRHLLPPARLRVVALH